MRAYDGLAVHLNSVTSQRTDPMSLVYKENNEFKLWFQRVPHLPYLPEHLRLWTATALMNVDFVTLTSLQNSIVNVFKQYFTATFITPKPISDFWGHFKTGHTNTTNDAEGWHSGLPSQLPNLHPHLSELIAFFQLTQHAAQNRMQALRWDPLAVAKHRNPVFVMKAQKLKAEMTKFETYFQHPEPLGLTFADILMYLDNLNTIGLHIDHIVR